MNIDPTKFSRPYNVTIDTKFCVVQDDYTKKFVVFHIGYDGGEYPTVKYSHTIGKDNTSIKFNCWGEIKDINSLTHMFSQFCFMTEDECFLELI